MRARFATMPHVRSTFMPLGKPADALAAKGKLARWLAYVPSVVSLARAALFVLRKRIQVIHSTDRPRDASYTALLGKVTGAISVVHMHAPVTDLTRPTMWGMRNATGIFAVSDAVREKLIELELSPGKISTVYNAVDADYFDPDQPLEPRPIREQFGIPADALLAGIAARMNPWKGQYELIGAVSLLRQTFPNLHIMILGSEVPEMRAEYEKRARAGGIGDRLHFGGFQKDVRPFLHEFDLFVHPSYGEPFGLSIAEAMAMRRPVIACDTGGVPEIITHGKDGWLVEQGSAEAVAAAMTTLLEDAELRKRIGAHARETIRNRFTPAQQCDSAAKQYQKLIAAA
jgi:glycosyltransferase involved in cell wall biosynthesis